MALIPKIILERFSEVSQKQHLQNSKRSQTIEIKSQTKDGTTFVLPDGSEFHDETDRRQQNMYDMYSAMSRAKDSSPEEDE